MNPQLYSDFQHVLICLQNAHMAIDMSLHKQQNSEKQMESIVDVLE